MLRVIAWCRTRSRIAVAMTRGCAFAAVLGNAVGARIFLDMRRDKWGGLVW